MIEAKCTRCNETFIPHSTKDEDQVHGQREDESPCGGLGVIMGEWVGPNERPRMPGDRFWDSLTLLEKHALEMSNCEDPDCEFHHPEVREF